MIGVVKTNEYYYVVDDAETKYDIDSTVNFDDLEFDMRLHAAKNLPEMRNKPIASWLIGRLAFLTDCRLGVYNGETQNCDGGSFVIASLIYDIDHKCIGEMQIQAADGIAIFLKCSFNAAPENILRCFAHALLEEPDSLGDFMVYVRDTENGSKRTYGYHQGKLLGRLHAS
jgi:hypothetical protein